MRENTGTDLPWPLLGAHLLVGYLAATEGLRLAQPGGARLLAIGLAVWLGGIAGGALAVWRDTREAPRMPWQAVVLAGFGAGLAWHLPPLFRLAYLVAAGIPLGVAIGSRRRAGSGAGDWAVAMLLGGMTTLAGYALAEEPFSRTAGLLTTSSMILFGVLVPLRQLARPQGVHGDLARWMGARATLILALVGMVLAFGLILAALWASGWSRGRGWRAGVLFLAFLGWMVVLVPWREAVDRGEAVGVPGRRWGRALWAWAVTELAMAVVWTQG